MQFWGPQPPPVSQAVGGQTAFYCIFFRIAVVITNFYVLLLFYINYIGLVTYTVGAASQCYWAELMLLKCELMLLKCELMVLKCELMLLKCELMLV